MKSLKLAVIPLFAAMVFACTHKEIATPTERVVEDVDSATGIISLRDYTMTDSITVGGKTYTYTLSLEHVDSMPIVINPQGLEYHESRVKISVNNGNSEFFKKVFYKRNFSDFVPSHELETSTMVGVNYNYTKQNDNTALYFIVSVGDPDEASDMVWPLELKVLPDGTFSIHKAENLDTEPISTGLTVDPSDDAEV
ncbi:MAG: DUF4738 domain-containing protein [Prevotellaceae bacterium]|nr:DUF4738 domain-containing protein [Candidatus Minthosoma equi]